MAVQLPPVEGQTPRWLYGDTPDGCPKASAGRSRTAPHMADLFAGYVLET